MRLWDKLGPRGTDLLLALACAVAMFGVAHLFIMERAEWFIFDRLTQWTMWSRPLDPSLAIVAIDDKSIEELGDPATKGWAWPWPRGAYADLVAFLRASGAKEIWIDLTFVTPDADSYQDDELRAVAAAAGNVRFGQLEGSRSVFQPTFDVTLPLATTVETVIHTDRSGQHLLAWPRPFNRLIQDANSPVTPAAPLVIEGEKMLKALSADDRTDSGKVPALWSRAPDSPLAARFRDKIVYIGVSAVAGYDLKVFPVGAREPSVMIHVVERSNAIQDGFIRPIPAWLYDVGILVCCLLVGGLFRPISDFRLYAFTVVALVVAISAAAYVLFLQRIWIGWMLYELSVVATFLVFTAANYVREGRKRRMTEELFGKFVSRKIVDRLVARPDQLKLGGEKAELTVMFSDLGGFTTISETMPSDVLLSLLNRYLNEMSELIYEREGTLDKYIGDAIMAFWGAPDASPNHAWQACHAALACQERLAKLAPVWQEPYGVKLTARIGINSGEMTVGLVGSSRLHNYSVIGDGVNFGSRLESANKVFGTSILIAQRTMELAGDKIEVRPVAKLVVKGKTQPVMVYELLARGGELDTTRKLWQEKFTAGYAAYQAGRWNEASCLFEEALAIDPHDALAVMYLQRATRYQAEPPGLDWDVFKLDEK
jgi:adenylate cyclase